MKIEGNQKELDAMAEFHKGNRVEGLRLQEEFAAEFRKEIPACLCNADESRYDRKGAVNNRHRSRRDVTDCWRRHWPEDKDIIIEVTEERNGTEYYERCLFSLAEIGTGDGDR